MTDMRSESARFATWSRALLDLVFPPHCVGCGRSGAWLCPECADSILFYEPPWPQLLQEIHPLQQARAAAHLEGALRQAIHAFKYEGLRALGGALGEILYDCWQADPWPVDAIAPVPLHPERLRQRGYNQSCLLVRELSRRTGLPAAAGTLVRLIPTPPQVGLHADQRAANVENAFGCSDAQLAGRHVLLIDDVMTTGATLRACAHALLQGGSAGVWAMTLAHD